MRNAIAIAILQKNRAQFPNAQVELDEFIHHSEIIAMTIKAKAFLYFLT